MPRLKEIWKKLKRWQLFGIIFGTFHITFLTMMLFSEGEGQSLIILELPTYMVLSIFTDFHDYSTHNWMYGYVIGTAVWSSLGIAIGYLIDVINNLLGG